MAELEDQQDARQINPDAEARLMKTRQGIMPGYNAQAMVSAVELRGKWVACWSPHVVDEAHDHARLIPMLQQAEDTTGIKAQTTLADAGYHSGSNLEVRQGVVMPEQHKALKRPYHRFTYDESTGSAVLKDRDFPSRVKLTRGTPMRMYRSATVCRRCPARGLYQRPTPWTTGDRASRRGAA